MQLRKCDLCLLLMLLLLAPVLAEPKPINAFDKNLGLRSRNATEAIARYRAAEEKANDIYLAAEREARATLIKDLEAARSQLKEAGSEDEAIRVGDAIDLAKTGPLPLPGEAPKAKTGTSPVGKWLAVYPDGDRVSVIIRADGTAEKLVDDGKVAGTWKEESNRLVLRWGNNGEKGEMIFTERSGKTLLGKNRFGETLKLVPAEP